MWQGYQHFLKSRGTLVKTLQNCGYHFQEFLLSPTCLGIPNSRLRYFLIAKLQSEPFAFQTTNKILETFPSTNESESTRTGSDLGLEEHPQTDTDQKKAASSAQCPGGGFVYKLETAEDLQRKQSQDNDSSIQTLQDFLEENTEEISQYLLPPKSLLRYALILDIVKPTCRRSICFTKGYGHYVEGTGSVLQMATDVEISSVYKSLETLSDEEKLAKLSTMKLRYFTPREIANLHGFAADFGFPEKITSKQRYRLLGNSLNVHIVARLVTLLLQSH
ncbi:unnamed protein product [Staurois parvus]|uniref:tRNA (Cytosine(38)-C(5))-methyltransferase n=1 Tax=Staurois parvus TaxID=386267 RepID=A0ABN9AGT6_9NEOB|nr:unnamed protein product [Staurois parvus]